MKKLVFMLIVMILMLISCDNRENSDDLIGATWGMTPDEVITFQEANENHFSLHEEFGEKGRIVAYEDFNIENVTISASYYFEDEIFTIDTLPPEVFDDDLFDYYQLLYNNEGDKISQIDDETLALHEEYNDLPTRFTLSKPVLVYTNYNLTYTTDEDIQTLFNLTVDKYGIPDEGSTTYNENFDYAYWYTDNTIIHFSFDNIRFRGTYYGLEEWVTGGKGYDSIEIRN